MVTVREKKKAKDRSKWDKHYIKYKFSLLRDVFFRSGVTTACLRGMNIMRCLRLLFTMELMTGKKDGRICFRMFVGSGSKQHDFEFSSEMSFNICSDTLCNEFSFPILPSAVSMFDERALGNISL